MLSPLEPEPDIFCYYNSMGGKRKEKRKKKKINYALPLNLHALVCAHKGRQFCFNFYEIM